MPLHLPPKPNIHRASCTLRQPSRLFFLLLVLCALSATTANAQTTSFTYQGKLNDGGSPAGGSYDMQFKLFDALNGGNLIGTNSPTNVQVTGGIFSVQLDFGAGAFPGAARWLEISVRLAGGGSFTALAPRSPISSTPYAIRSLNAASSDNAANAANAILATNATQLGGIAANQYVLTTDPRLTDARAPTAGSANYIQNSTMQQLNTNFNIKGSGTVDGILTGKIVDAAMQYNFNGLRLIGFGPTGANNNFLVGTLAGNALTTGRENTFLGISAGELTIGGNIACANCGPGGTPVYQGSHNVFVGLRAGRANTTGYNNSFFGNLAGFSNAGSENTFLGVSAGYSNTGGSANTFVGVYAGASNTISNGNSFFGYHAGRSNTTGDSNSFFGLFAGLNNTTGGFNSFFGQYAGRDNGTGHSNSFFGEQAGRDNTTGHDNSFFGRESGASNTTGRENVFFGKAAGAANTSGSGNIMLGDSANFQAEPDILDAPQVGDYNIFIGKQAGGDSSRRDSVAIGTRAFVGCDYCMVLGDSLFPAFKVGIGTTTPAHKLHVVNTSTTSGAALRVEGTNSPGGAGDGIHSSASASGAYALYAVATSPATMAGYFQGNVTVTGTFSNPSDQRYKQGIQPLSQALDKLTHLRGVSYEWKREEFPRMNFVAGRQIGLLAQEVEKVFPEAVQQDRDGMYSVSYLTLIPVLIEAVKEQQQQVEAANAAKDKQLEQLRQENAALRQRLEAVEKALEKIVNK